MLGRGATVLTVPVPGERVYAYCDARASADVGPRAPLEALRGSLAGFADPAATLLAGLGPGHAVHAGPLEEVVLERWRRGRVVLVGDAAHATSPNMAQGVTARRSRTRSCSPAACARPGPSPTRSRRSSAGAARGRTGSGRAPIAGTACAACRPRSGTACSVAAGRGVPARRSPPAARRPLTAPSRAARR